MVGFLKRSVGDLIKAICSFQALLWFFGYFEIVTELIKQKFELVVIGTLLYLALYYIGYDAPKQLEKLEYNKRFKKAGVSIRKKAKRLKNGKKQR